MMRTHSKSDSWAYSSALDQLRFFAATLVIFHHFRPYAAIPLDADGLRYFAHLWLVNGSMGVSLFLVLTGFLFSMNFQCGEKPVRYGEFIKRRALRIVPMYALVMLMLMTQSRGTWSVSDFLTFATFQVNGGHPWTGFGHDRLPIGPIWTIGVEFQFYLIFPLLIAAIPPSRWKGILGIVAVFFVFRLLLGLNNQQAEVAYYNAYHTLLGRFDQFVIGMAAAYMYHRWMLKISRVVSWLCVLLAVVMLNFWMQVFSPLSFPLNMLTFPVEAIIFSLVIVGYHSAGGVRGAIGWVLTSLGKASYSLYLLHYLVGTILVASVVPSLPHELAEHHWLKVICLIFVPSILLSLLTYHAVEKPFMRLGRDNAKRTLNSLAP